MRDRLIELLRDTFNYTRGVCIDFDEAVEINADHLLANGVIVPPCKVGDTVYKIATQRDNFDDKEYSVVIQVPFTIEKLNSIGKTVFFTREEAEQALKGGEQG